MDSCNYCKEYHRPFKICESYIKAIKEGKVEVMKIHQMLKESREKSGVSQLKLSSALGYSSAQFISNVERGMCNPPLDKLAEWCKIIGLEKKKAYKCIQAEFDKKLKKYLGE